MTSDEVLNHWRYFLTLENDLLNTQNYVEFSLDNFKTYSFEFSKIFQLACSEIDSICRILCKLIDEKNTFSDDTGRSGNITKYSEVILEKYPKLVNIVITIPISDLKFIPFKNWSNKTPEWWTKYNKVKHYRHSNFSNANLENVLNSLSALLIINLYLNRVVKNEPFSQSFLETKLFDCVYLGDSIKFRSEKPLPDFIDDMS